MSPAKKRAAPKPAEPLIEWQAKPPTTTFDGTIGDITYRINPGYTDDGNFTWLTYVQLSDNKPRTIEEAKDLAEKDLH